MNDLRFALRQLLKNPGFTAVSVFTLALGVCAVTMQFSLFNGVWLRGLPFPEPDRLAGIAMRDPSTPPNEGAGPSFGDFLEWQRQQQSCEALAASDSFRWLNVTMESGPRPLGGLLVTHNFFSVLGVRPLLGRDFTAADDQPGAERVALISHEIWMRDFGGVGDVVGRTFRLEGQVTTVIGVMPPGFAYPEHHQQLWAPLGAARDQPVSVVGRLKQGISLDQATTEFAGIAQRLAQTHSGPQRRFTSARVMSLHEDLAGGMRGVLSALLLGAVAVLGIACVNVMNLQFVRVSARMRELAMRRTLGASQGRLLGQMLLEGSLLAVLGGSAGVALSIWTTQFFRSALGRLRFDALPVWAVTEIDSTVMLFALAVIAVSAVLSSLLPAFLASRADAMAVLKEGAHGQTHRSIGRIGGALVMAQISLTCALLIASLLQVKSITRHANVDVGFQTDRVLAGRLRLDVAYRDPGARAELYGRLLRELRVDPAFTDVALTSRSLAVGGGFSERFEVEGGPQAVGAEGSLTALEYISDGYFTALGLRVREGREFQAGERNGAQPALVNETFARKHFGNSNALGRRVRVVRPDSPRSEWRTVVGVVPDTHLQNFDPERDGAGVFLPMAEFVPNYPTVIVRGRGRAEALVEPLQRAMAKFDSNLALYGVATPRASLRAFNGQARAIAGISSGFALVACALAAIGLYGVASYAVSRRLREVGIRMALGANRTRIMALVLGRGGWQFIVGTTAGIALALALIQVGGARFEHFLYQVNPHDPAIYLGVIALLAVSTLLACWLPARRASRVEPMVALRTE